MSTFFDKLTGTKPKTAPAAEYTEEETETAEAATAPVMPVAKETSRRAAPVRRAAPASERPRSTQLRVEPEETPMLPPAEQPEEEGELTVDIYDRGDSIVIQSTVAGVKPEDLDVSITTDTVTIRGSRNRTEEVEEKNYYYKELFWGSFSRSVILPEEIDDTSAEASLKNGLLTIRLPKKKKGITQKLKVKVS